MMASSATTDYDNAVSDFGEYTIGEMAYTGGLVAGFNRQMGNMVYGLEADFSATSFDETHRFRASRENRHAMNWLATFRGRVGMAAGSSLLYATGGLAVANMDYVFRNTTALPGADHNETRLGFAAGFGFEHDLGNSWAIRTEAMHIALPTFTDTTTDAGGNPLDFTTSANIARTSLIKRF